LLPRPDAMSASRKQRPFAGRGISRSFAGNECRRWRVGRGLDRRQRPGPFLHRERMGTRAPEWAG
jgi:hypothetical protein